MLNTGHFSEDLIVTAPCELCSRQTLELVLSWVNSHHGDLQANVLRADKG